MMFNILGPNKNMGILVETTENKQHKQQLYILATN